MKRTVSAVATAVLLSMMAVMFLGGLLKKAARVVDGLDDPLTQPPPPPDDNAVHVRNGSGYWQNRSGLFSLSLGLLGH